MNMQPHRIISADGRERTLSRHMLIRPHQGITPRQVEHVLDHWVIRGIKTDQDGTQSRIYLGFVPGEQIMRRVVVSMDNNTIVTAFHDRNATRNWNRGNRDYFADRYTELEERNGTAGPL